MQSLNRNRELQEIIGPLTAFVGGNPAPGDTRVLCRGVSCLPRGGLTTFLDDLAEAMRGDAKLLPIRLTLEESLRAEAELRSASEILARHVGRTGAVDGQPETLFPLAETVWQTGRLAVLILDASAALTQIRKTDELRDRAASNPLLIALRALPNLIRHHGGSFSVVLGCHDDFLDHAADWGAQDIVQRYRLVSLWPDFGEAEPWPVYRKILEARGCRVAADFSGFPRSHLPVGEVLAALNGPEQVVDGPFLLDLLAQHGKVNKARPINPQLAIALALQDRTIDAAEEQLMEAVRAPAARWASHPIEGGRYQATTELYESLGLSPSRIRLSFAERLRRRFEIDHDPQVPSDVLRGVRALAGAGDGTIESTDDFVSTVVQLPDGWRPPNITARPLLRVYACIAETLPQALQDEIQEHVERIEKHALQTSELVVVLHREPAMDAQLRGLVAARLKERRTEFVNLCAGGVRGSRDIPSGLCTVQLTFPVVQGAVSFGLDTGLQDDFVDQARDALSSGVRDHYRALTRVLKPLSPTMFEGQVLSRLIVSTPAALTARELQENSGGLTMNRVQEILRGLEDVSAIQKGSNGYFWTYASDELLAQFPPGEPRRPDNLIRKFFFEAANWSRLVLAMRTAYSNDLLGGHGELVEGRDPSPLLKDRADKILRLIEDRRRQLHEAGDPEASGALAISLDCERRTLLEELDVGKLELACGRFWKMCREADQSLTEVERRRKEGKRHLMMFAKVLREASEVHDTTLQTDRANLLTDLDAAAGSEGVSLVHLGELQGKLTNLQMRFEVEQRRREDNVQMAGALTKNCRSLLDRLRGLTTEDAGLSARRAALKEGLDQAKDSIGDAKQHPAVAGEARRSQLATLSDNIEAARKELHQLGLAIEAARAKRPPPTPTTPAEPSLTTEGPPVLVEEPLRTVTPSAVTAPVSTPTSELPAAVTTEKLHSVPSVTAATAAEPLPVVTSPVSVLQTVPDPPTTAAANPRLDFRPPMPSSPTKRVYRFGPDQLDQLAELLRHHPELVELEVIE